MKKIYVVGSFVALVVFLTQCNKTDVFNEAGFDDRLSGGMATIFDETSKAFSHIVPGLNERDEAVHEIGDAAFEQTFVSAPAPVNSGLGPVFNNVSCISCHHNDGKGTPTAGLVNSSLLFRIGLPGKDEHGGAATIPGFGGQLQDVAIFGKQPEGKVTISYENEPVVYPDGEAITLRKPVYAVSNTQQPLPANFLLSPRMAPAVFGLGLLQAIPATTILGFADENDQNKDGISGKANYVYNPFTALTEIGRFGLKANTPNLQIQVASAYHQDMGITSYIFPRESSYGQPQADGLDDEPELADSLLNAVVFYVKTLAVPARRNTVDPTIKKGEAIFSQLNCSGCHQPTLQTGVDLQVKSISNQRIHPYTDLLLHDMGEGLADHREDFLATGFEWRTAPLWGIGLFQKTNGTPFYLHDGRARTIEEAILWHGGEGQQSKAQFMNLSKDDRKAMVKFLQSL
jgi:CxxC motif-containing protein (DUF1111 family)